MKNKLLLLLIPLFLSSCGECESEDALEHPQNPYVVWSGNSSITLLDIEAALIYSHYSSGCQDIDSARGAYKSATNLLRVRKEFIY